MNPRIAALAAAAAATFLSSCASETAAPKQSGWQTVVDSPLRTDADRKSDGRRLPADFLDFAQIRPGMTVLDVSSGGGYTAALEAVAVGPTGHVYAQQTEAKAGLKRRLDEHPMPNLTELVSPDESIADRLTPGSLDRESIVLSYHDISFEPVDRHAMNQSLFRALKPGGKLIVIDHAAQSGHGIGDAKVLHRIEDRTVIDEMQQAGFRLETTSDAWRVPTDPKTQPFFKMDAASDRFALRFVKPS